MQIVVRNTFINAIDDGDNVLFRTSSDPTSSAAVRCPFTNAEMNKSELQLEEGSVSPAGYSSTDEESHDIQTKPISDYAKKLFSREAFQESLSEVEKELN
jgi:hypothetical protein